LFSLFLPFFHFVPIFLFDVVFTVYYTIMISIDTMDHQQTPSSPHQPSNSSSSSSAAPLYADATVDQSYLINPSASALVPAPSPDVPALVQQATIESLRSEIAMLGNNVTLLVQINEQQQQRLEQQVQQQVQQQLQQQHHQSTIAASAPSHAQYYSETKLPEQPTPFHRGITYQSNVGVNRDHTPHPVVVKAMGGMPYSNMGAAAAQQRERPIPDNMSESSRDSRPSRSSYRDRRDYHGDEDGEDERAYNGVKVPLPPRYKGLLTTDSSALRVFIQQMERYMAFKQISMVNNRSRDFAITFLDGVASQWWESVKTDASIDSWQTLKAALIRRFEPEDVVERETFALLNLVFRTNVTVFNHDFITHLQLAHEELRNNEVLLIYLYRDMLRKAQGTGWLCTMLKTAIRSEALSTLSDVMNAALRLEATLTSGRKANAAATATATATTVPAFRGTQTTAGSSGSPYRVNNSNSRFARPSSSTPVRKPQFNSPVRVNHMRVATEEDVHDEDIGDLQLSNMEFEHEIDIEDDGEVNHEDEVLSSSASMSSATAVGSSDSVVGVAGDQNALVLNAMKAQQKFGGRFALPPEELLRCRQNGLCFKCKRPGHMSSACPTSSQSGGNNPSKKL
jgi:hypothetical protein